MNKTNDLIKTLEQFYGEYNTASMFGYLIGVLKELEYTNEGAAEIIASHAKWIKTGIEKEAA